MTWVQDATRIWATHIGLVPHGRMGRALKPLMDLFGPEEVLVWLTTYCELAPTLGPNGLPADGDDADLLRARNSRFLTPEAFASTYVAWKRLSEHPRLG